MARTQMAIDAYDTRFCGCTSGAGDEWTVYLCQLHKAAPALLEMCIEAREALLAFGLSVISNDLDTDSRLAEAMKCLEGLGARLDAVIVAARRGGPLWIGPWIDPYTQIHVTVEDAIAAGIDPDDLAPWNGSTRTRPSLLGD